MNAYDRMPPRRNFHWKLITSKKHVDSQHEGMF